MFALVLPMRAYGFLTILLCFCLQQTQAIVRKYYIKAENVLWDYAPHSRIDMSGRPIMNNQTLFQRTLYVGYNDNSFTQRLPHPDHLGDLGPVIRAEVDDTIEILLINDANIPVTMHAHGVQYEKSSDGTMEQAIPPSGNFTYTWHIRPEALTDDLYPTLWAYHSHVSETDIYDGLIGPIVVYPKGHINHNHDLEFFIKPLVDKPTARHSVEVEEDHKFFAINGYIYNNMPTLTVPVNSDVTWFLFTFGDEEDIHMMHWHGNVVKRVANHSFADVVPLFPASFETAVMKADTRGTWMFHCHVAEHMMYGMYMHYTVV